jgi:hypothetical protein
MGFKWGFKCVVLLLLLRDWKTAGLEVSSACDKYEAYVYRSTSLLKKLLVLRDRLSEASGSTLSADSGTFEDLVRTHQDSGRTRLEGPVTANEHFQLLRLVDLILLSFTRGNAGVENGLNHVLMLNGGGGAAEASGSPEWNRVRQLMEHERNLAAAVQSVLGPGPGPATVLNLFQVDWVGGYQSPHEMDAAELKASGAAVVQTSSLQGAMLHGDMSIMDISASGMCMDGASVLPKPQYCTVSEAGEASTTSCTAIASSSPLADLGSLGSNVQLPWAHDPLLQPLICRAAALGLPSGEILLERAVLKHLLTHHPHRPLREAVYVCGVLPRKEALLRLRAQMTVIRYCSGPR